MTERLNNIQPDSLILLLDVDGVLAPIVDDPDEAAVPASMLSVVREAVEKCAVTAIVTGRGFERAKQMVPLTGAWYATLHGVHIVNPNGDEDIDPVSAAAREHVEVAATLAQTVGWAYEDKGGTVTIHFRQRGNLGQAVDPAHVKAQLQTVINPLKVEVHDAKQVLEIKPKGVRTKGSAVEIILKARPANAKHVIYIGDDLTDLDAFLMMDELKKQAQYADLSFTKIAVGGEEAPKPLTDAADIVLSGEAEVEPLLRTLIGSA